MITRDSCSESEPTLFGSIGSSTFSDSSNTSRSTLVDRDDDELLELLELELLDDDDERRIISRSNSSKSTVLAANGGEPDCNLSLLSVIPCTGGTGSAGNGVLAGRGISSTSNSWWLMRSDSVLLSNVTGFCPAACSCCCNTLTVFASAWIIWS